MYMVRDAAAPARSRTSIRGYGSLRAQGRQLSVLTLLATTEQTASQLLLSGRRLLLLQPLLLLGVMAAVEAAGGRAEHAVMGGIVAGDAADHRALQAALGTGRVCSQREGGDGEQGGNRFHGGNPLSAGFQSIAVRRSGSIAPLTARSARGAFKGASNWLV